MSKTVEVTTDSAAMPKLTLTMKGQIEVLAAFERPYLDLGRVPMGVTKTETVRVEAKDPAALKLSNLRVSDASVLKAEIVDDGGPASVKVTFKAGEAPGNVSGVVTVTTNVAQVGDLTLQVRAKVGGDLDVTPPTAVLSPFEKGQPAPEITLRVTSASGQPFHLLKVDDPAGALAGTVSPQGNGWLVRVIARKAPKTSSGFVYVVTDRKDQPRLPIPFLVSDPAASLAKMPTGVRSIAPSGAPQPGKPAGVPTRPVAPAPAPAPKPAH